MIVRGREHDFIMITQHDHACFSGDIARRCRNFFAVGREYWDDVVVAIYEHDRAWIGLDDTPIWNDAIHAPFTFLNYPLLPKLAFYRIGMDEVEQMNPYAGLLCSLHYSSFFVNTEQPDGIAFAIHEQERQRRIRQQVAHINEETILQHFRLLQFCDDTSLYVCLNEPGSSKKEEHPWYRDGIPNTEVVMSWLNDQEIKASPFPFEEVYHVKLKYKSVSKPRIAECGIGRAYKEAELLEQEVTFSK